MKKIENVKKISITYFLFYILAGTGVTAAGTMLSIVLGNGLMAAAVLMLTMIFVFFWCYLAGKWIFKKRKKAFLKELEASGFLTGQILDDSSAMLAVDSETGRIALIFRWNPFQGYVLPARRITKIWVDDGRSGKGILEGSAYVSLEFIIDGVRAGIYTLFSRRRYAMASEHVVTGIAMAAKMADAVNAAKGNA